MILGGLFTTITLATLVKAAALVTNVGPTHRGVVAGAFTVFLGMRAWQSYKNKRNIYYLDLSRFLFFKLLANNKGV